MVHVSPSVLSFISISSVTTYFVSLMLTAFGLVSFFIFFFKMSDCGCSLSIELFIVSISLIEEYFGVFLNVAEDLFCG